jgi:hypothetical protein
MYQASLGEFFGVNEAAGAAYQARDEAFNGPSGIEGLVAQSRAGEAVQTDVAVPVAGMSVQDSFSEEELQAYREHQGMYVGRGKAYEEVLALVQREYRKEMHRPANPRTARKGGGKSSGGGRKYSATQCRQLLAQIQEYRRVLPAYSAAGQGGPIRMGIQANQRAYNAGCR